MMRLQRRLAVLTATIATFGAMAAMPAVAGSNGATVTKYVTTLHYIGDTCGTGIDAVQGTITQQVVFQTTPRGVFIRSSLRGNNLAGGFYDRWTDTFTPNGVVYNLNEKSFSRFDGDYSGIWSQTVKETATLISKGSAPNELMHLAYTTGFDGTSYYYTSAGYRDVCVG